jgi:hypothetical protein
MSSAISCGGAFVFLVLSIWLAMHAAVAAQAFEARLLTQIVRLPVPSWSEVEACRTYGAEFEQVEARQMFRVPWLAARRQENLVREPGGSALSAVQEEPGASETPQPLPTGPSRQEQGGAGQGQRRARSWSPPKVTQADPWGLERRGDDLEELGCKVGSAVAKSKHIRLVRGAMIYWQAYDAFARISLSVGVNQLLLGLTYFLLGAVGIEAGSRAAAGCGAFLLTVIAQTMLKLDMSLSTWKLRGMQVLHFMGPACGVLATAHQVGGDAVLANYVVEISFFAHACFLFCLCYTAL